MEPFSALTGGPVANSMKLLDTIDKSVSPKVNVMLWDDCCKRTSRTDRPAGERSVAFPPVECYAVEGATLSPGRVLYGRNQIYVDHSLRLSMNAKLFDDVANAWREKAHEHLSKTGVEPPEHIPGTVYIACNEGSGTWGHWIVHNLPRVLLFLERFPNGRVAIPDSYLGAGRLKACGEALDLAGVPRERLIPLRGDRAYTFDLVVLIGLMYRGLCHPTASRYFDNIIKNASSKWTDDCRRHVGENGVFIIRAAAESRNIANLAEIENVARKYGFGVYTQGQYSLYEQIGVWQTAHNVISTLGSDLTNIVFGVASQQVLSITPEWFGDIFFYNLATWKNLAWSELFCGSMKESRQPVHASSFGVNPESFTTFLEESLRKRVN